MDVVKLFYPESTQITSHVVGVVPAKKCKQIPRDLVFWQTVIMRSNSTLIVIKAEAAEMLRETTLLGVKTKGLFTAILPIFTVQVRDGTKTLFYEPDILTFMLYRPDHFPKSENYVNKVKGRTRVMGIFGRHLLTMFNTHPNDNNLYPHILAFRQLGIDATPEFRACHGL